MPLLSRNVAILGSTGSIGGNTLEVIEADDQLNVFALSAHSSLKELCRQAEKYLPRYVVAAQPELAKNIKKTDLPRGTELLVGSAGMEKLCSHPEVDIVVAAVVGSAGLRGTWAALEAGKTVALANKETLVMAGPLAADAVAKSGATILPVDSEHSAIFQALSAGKRSEVKRIVLTASGGAFRDKTAAELKTVTPEDALCHPTWNMGPKITVDSASMMNKALEVIEARWLFDFTPEQMGVMIHPQSIIHSLVEYNDGAVIAQLSPPDMKLPIQYALTWPERRCGRAETFDWTGSHRLELFPPDEERFPALPLGFEVAKAGGTTGAVLNAANEAAVAAFLNHELPFIDIVPACRAVLEHHEFESNPSLEKLFELDAWARREVTKWVCT